MPTIGERVTFIGSPAGGVLSGTYPDPEFAQPMSTVADLNEKANVDHTHAASAVTSGTLAIDRVPTSTSTVATAVPKADDPRLSNARPWSRYTTSGTATTGQVPTWTGSLFAPATPPAAQPVPDATLTTKGLIQLAGDLGGTATAPRVTIRGPIGGHLASPTTTGTINLNAATGNSFYISATATVSINPPTNGTDGQRLVVEVFASGAARTATIPTAITGPSGLSRSLSIGAGKIALIEMVYSTRIARWVAMSALVEQ